MSTPRQLRNLNFNLSLGSALTALAIAFLLVVVATPAQAQTFKVIHNFSGGQDGASPNAGVTLDRAGNLYGTAYGGGIGAGTVYQLKHKGSGWTFNPLYSFHGGDGAYPRARVIFGPNGTLYGTASGGGANGRRHGFQSETLPDGLHELCSAPGWKPCFTSFPGGA